MLLLITREVVRAVLRRDLPSVMLASVFVAIAFATGMVYYLRKRSRDRALLWFCLVSFLYGVRLLAATDAVRIALGGPDLIWIYIAGAITYSIGLPIALLLWEIFPAWRPVLRFVLWIEAVFAVTGVLSDAIQKTPESLSNVNDGLVLLGMAAFLFALFRQRTKTRDIQTVQFGLLTFSLALVLNNLDGLLGWKWTFNPEPLGLLVLLISLARLLAGRALQNEERLLELDKELDIARRIQTSILPQQTPEGPHWDIAARYLPMTAVAGDFYDFLVLDERRLGILVADVSGHGVPAALIASMVKVAVASELRHVHNPAKVLAGMNRTLCGKMQGQYVTAAFLYLDLAARKMRYAAAGHPALLWHHMDGQVQEVVENGLMLGLFPGASYTEWEGDLHPGDTFLLYTDGLLEAANGTGEFFGDARTKSILTESRTRPANEVVDLLLQRVSDWSAFPQDDLTLIAVGWRTVPGTNLAAAKP